MCALNIPHEEAFAHVQARRFCISPNQGFQHQIEAYQHIWEAMNQCASDPNLNLRPTDARRKRNTGMDEDDEEDELARGGIVAPHSSNRIIRKARPRLSPQDEPAIAAISRDTLVPSLFPPDQLCQRSDQISLKWRRSDGLGLPLSSPIINPNSVSITTANSYFAGHSFYSSTTTVHVFNYYHACSERLTICDKCHHPLVYVMS